VAPRPPVVPFPGTKQKPKPPDPPKIPDWRPLIFDTLADVYKDRIGRPSVADDDWDLVAAIEDMMDEAFTQGRQPWRRNTR
jgi:hypothetical protein